jgi:hypothetical protein
MELVGWYMACIRSNLGPPPTRHEVQTLALPPKQDVSVCAVQTKRALVGDDLLLVVKERHLSINRSCKLNEREIHDAPM